MPMVDKKDELVVFFSADGDPFSMDPRWQDSRVREQWLAEHGEKGEVLEERLAEVDDDSDEDVLPPYQEMTNDQLRAELAARELSVDGKKADMIARLEKDDSESEV